MPCANQAMGPSASMICSVPSWTAMVPPGNSSASPATRQTTATRLVDGVLAELRACSVCIRGSVPRTPSGLSLDIANARSLPMSIATALASLVNAASCDDEENQSQSQPKTHCSVSTSSPQHDEVGEHCDQPDESEHGHRAPEE